MSTTTTRNWPTALEQSQGDWTGKYRRPTERNGFDPRVLARYQSEWDRAEELRQLGAQIRARREAEKQTENDRLAAEQETRRQKAREDEEAMLRRRFLAAGGTEAEWQREKDAVLAEHRRHQVVVGATADDRARVANAGRYRSA